MNKRRRFGAKRRRREARLKQMWLSGGLTAAELFKRLSGTVCAEPEYSWLGCNRITYSGRGTGHRLASTVIIPAGTFTRPGDRARVTITGRLASPPEFQTIRARDLHQERADREGIPRSLAKARNYSEHYGTGLSGVKKHLGID